MPKTKPQSKNKQPETTPSKPSKKARPEPAPSAPSVAKVAPKEATTEPTRDVTKDAPLALRIAVLEDVIRRTAQETRVFQTKLDTFAASQSELARRVADVEKKRAS